MSKLVPLVGLLLLAAACRTAPASSPRSSAPAASSASVRMRRYYLLKGPATVGWVSDHPFRWVSYDDRAGGELSAATKAASFQAFARAAKQKGYRLVATKAAP